MKQKFLVKQNRERINTILLFAFFAVIGVMISYVSSVITKTEYIQLVSNNLYSDQAVSWTGSSDSIDSYTHFVKTDEILYADITMCARGVYFTADQITFPMLRGRFYIPSDFSKANNYVVIGRNYVDDIRNEDGISYYDFQGEVFQVIGVIGLPQSSMFDQMLLFNMANVSEWITPNTIWSIDSYSQKRPDIGNLTAANQATLIYRENTGIDRITGSNALVKITLFFYMNVFIMLLLASWFFVAKNEKLIHIYQLLGSTPGQILGKLFRKYMLSIFCGLAAGIIGTSWVLYKPYYHMETAFRYLFLALLVNVVLYLLFVSLILRKNLNNSLKSW